METCTENQAESGWWVIVHLGVGHGSLYIWAGKVRDIRLKSVWLFAVGGGIYIYIPPHTTFVYGDINGRISKLSDVIDFDNIPLWNNINDIVHGHGESLIEFLNGRFQPEEDTCISGRGKSVVDYIITPHDCFYKCIDFMVLTSNEIIDQFNLQGLISAKCKPSDHSVVTCSFQTMNPSLYTEIGPSQVESDPFRIENSDFNASSSRMRYQLISWIMKNRDR